MKILSGWAHNLPLKSTFGPFLRPTSQLVREAVVNSLGAKLNGAKILDLFAGSGAIGFELLSRGGIEAVFVEKEPKAIKCINQNITSIEKRALSEKVKISDINLIKTPLQYSWKKLLNNYQNYFDIIWADPPYNDLNLWIKDFCDFIPSLMANRGVFVIESAKRNSNMINNSFNNTFYLIKDKRYGDSYLTFWNIKDNS